MAKVETGALCVLDDEISRTIKYVKPMNLVIGKDEEGNPIKLKDVVNTLNKLVDDNEKLKQAVIGCAKSIELLNANIEQLKVEVM